MPKKKILIICYSNHSKEPRLLMQCSALKNNYEITTAGFSEVMDSDIKFIKLNGLTQKAFFTFHLNLSKILRLPFSILNKLQVIINGFSLNFQYSDYKILKKFKFDLIICHHPPTLELGYKLKKYYQSKLIFNAHEIYPYEFEENQAWMDKNFKSIDFTLKKYFSKCDNVFTVNQDICNFYLTKYGRTCIPIHNSKPFYDISVSPLSNPIKIIHHGAAMPRRKLEQMADAVIQLNGKYELTFMLVESVDGNYLNTLKDKYLSKGIKFINPVQYSDIISTINKYDIGLYILPNDNINQQLALPNKLFEFIQAKLAIVASPNPAMKNIIETYKVGVVADGYSVSDMVNVLNTLTTNSIEKFKNQSKIVSQEVSAQKDEDQIKAAINGLLNTN